MSDHAPSPCIDLNVDDHELLERDCSHILYNNTNNHDEKTLIK